MPELPEVETIKLQLEKRIKGETIRGVEVLNPRLINVSVPKFISKTKGVKIKSLRRRAKLLVIDLSSGDSLLVHLKLTGLLIMDQKPDKHTSVIFEFEGSKKLLYKDLRKFGYMKLLSTSQTDKILNKEFGPEPLSKDFTPEKFKELLLKKKKAKIKPLLMDQKFLAGIGNIYAQETCFYAKVNPERKVGTLENGEVKDVYDGLRKIMNAAIKSGGTSVDAYRDVDGREGNFITRLKVYGREGQECFRCGAKIKAIKLSGRTTCFCPKCQR